MTVIFSKSCEIGLQAVLFLSTQPANKLLNASEIAESINQPREYVSKMLQLLTASGIVHSKKGKNGGFSLGKNPRLIRLIDIVYAIDGLDLFNNCVLGFQGCGTLNNCPVHDKWGKLRDEAFKMLSEDTLFDLTEKTKNKISGL